MKLNKDDLHLYEDTDALYAAAAAQWVTLAERAIDGQGGFHVALSGGSTPRGLYERLASPPCQGRIAWDKVHIYFGDERCVGPEHAESNYRMAKESLLQDAPIPATQIHRMAGESEDLEGTAAGYAQLLSTQLPEVDGARRFDLVMLGLGPDGHVASLFPQSPALSERTKWVLPVHVAKLDAWRLTITLPVIEAARSIMLLVAGANKASIMGELMKDYQGHPRYPVEMINPQGRMEWYIDRAAAPFL